MKLYSTSNRKLLFDLKEAVLLGLAPDGGLFMPTKLPRLSSSFFSEYHTYTFPELCMKIAHELFKDSIPFSDLDFIVSQSISFPAPVRTLSKNLHVLELWHGPSLAFKDFGAQFMARLMSYFNQQNSKALNVLVATSGDTGSAVAAGFHNVPGINVIILYPKGKVSHLQEKQLTTFDNNICAIEIDGTFDHCQALVKKAFRDKKLSQSIRLTSANSINIARLIPQMFYYFEAAKTAHITLENPICFSVPSGNFGNLTAGLFAKKMGLPINRFIASTNINKVVPEYLTTSKYVSAKSIETISNAMDVGNPSNFARMLDLYGSTWNKMKADIVGFSFTDDETIKAIKQVSQLYDYCLDPHGAVAFLGAQQFHQKYPQSNIVILETAHPSKFKNVIDRALSTNIPIHPTLQKVQTKPSSKTSLPAKYDTFLQFMQEHYGS